MDALAGVLALGCLVLVLLWIFTFIGLTRRVLARAVLAPWRIPLRRARWGLALSAFALFVITGVVAPPEQAENQPRTAAPMASPSVASPQAAVSPQAAPRAAATPTQSASQTTESDSLHIPSIENMMRIRAKLETITASQLGNWRPMLAGAGQAPPRLVPRSEGSAYARALWCEAAFNLGVSFSDETAAAVMNSPNAQALTAEIALMMSANETPVEVTQTFHDALRDYRESNFTEDQCPELIHKESPEDGMAYSIVLMGKVIPQMLRLYGP